MTVYVDTSVVLRFLLHESNPVEIWGQWNQAYSSGLWLIEALRTADRLRLTHEISDTELAELVRDIRITHETFAIHSVTDRILQRAGDVPHGGRNSGCDSSGHGACDTRDRYC